MRPPSSRCLVAAMLVAAVVSGIAGVFVSSQAQITTGLAEDHFLIGQALWHERQPLPVFRAPG